MAGIIFEDAPSHVAAGDHFEPKFKSINFDMINNPAEDHLDQARACHDGSHDRYRFLLEHNQLLHIGAQAGTIKQNLLEFLFRGCPASDAVSGNERRMVLWRPARLVDQAPVVTRQPRLAFAMPWCSFWLQHRLGDDYNAGKGPRGRAQFARHVCHTNDGHAAAPYLGVQYYGAQEGSGGAEEALKEIVRSGVLVLYNRFCLEERAKASRDGWKLSDKRFGLPGQTAAAYYGIILSERKYQVWVIEPIVSRGDFDYPDRGSTRDSSYSSNPELSDEAEKEEKVPEWWSQLTSFFPLAPRRSLDIWGSSNTVMDGVGLPCSMWNILDSSPGVDDIFEPPRRTRFAGCMVRNLASGNYTTENELDNLVDWINNIHLWGVGVHAPSVETDIEYCENEAV